MNVVGSSMILHTAILIFVDNQGSVWLTDVVLEANLKERVICMPLPSTNKAAHSGFETQIRCH